MGVVRDLAIFQAIPGGLQNIMDLHVHIGYLTTHQAAVRTITQGSLVPMAVTQIISWKLTALTGLGLLLHIDYEEAYYGYVKATSPPQR